MDAHTTRMADICIAGAGIIGLSLALELHQRGLRVTVLEQSMPLSEASIAAAGMLAAADPHNPHQLRPLSDLSITLYPSFLERLHQLSGQIVPFQTCTTLQSIPRHSAFTALSQSDLSRLFPALHSGDHRFALLDEHSLDPRQLAAALLKAVQNTTINLRTHTPVLSTEFYDDCIRIATPFDIVHAHQFVDCTGSWSTSAPCIHVRPKKGQLLYITLPKDFRLNSVVRTGDIYIVPRTVGPNAGRALIGATVEDAGFDKTVHSSDISALHALASELIPFLTQIEPVESWAGLRPATSDDLPLLGLHPSRPNHFFATGHYRNGILLAPATAHVMTQLILGEKPSVDLNALSPARNLQAHA